MSGSQFLIKRIAAGVIGMSVMASVGAQPVASGIALMTRGKVQQEAASEAELLSAKVGKGVIRLRDGEKEWKAIYDRLYALGQIRSVTHNGSVVVERIGSVTKARLNEEGRVVPPTGFLGGAIDLRFMMDKWRSGFALEQADQYGKVQYSLQFYDHTGTAVNKIFLDNNQAVPAFRKLVVDFKAPVQRVVFKAEPLPHKTGAKPVTTEDVKELKLSWSELTDVHDFGRLLKDLGISREQSFELIGTDAAYKIAPRAVHVLFDEAAKSGQPLLVFVSNPGIIQIYGGKVEQATAAGDWYQVQAPDFRMALRKAGIARGWVVKRPARDGMITSVEFYDANGDQIINIFSRREKNTEETAVWRKIVAGLEHAS